MKYGGANGSIHMERLLWTYRRLGECATGPICDVGFGHGLGTEILRELNPGTQIVGLETDLKAVDDAKRRWPNATFMYCSRGTWIFPDNSFNTVFALQVVEHVDEDAAFLRDLVRICRPKGYIVLSTPDRRGRLHPGERPWNPEHVREYSPGMLIELAQAVQVHSSTVYGVTGVDPELLAQERRRAGWGRKLAKYRLRWLRKPLAKLWHGTRPDIPLAFRFARDPYKEDCHDLLLELVK